MLTRQLAYRSLKHPCIHKVLEVRICEVCLDKFRLFFKHSGYDVDDVIVEGDLRYLLVAITGGIRKVNTCGDASWQFLNLTLHLVTIFPLEVAVTNRSTH